MKIRLITACGCEQTMDASGPVGPSLLMPLRAGGPPTANIDDFRLIDVERIYELKPMKCERREFVRSPSEDRDGYAAYRERLEIGALALAARAFIDAQDPLAQGDFAGDKYEELKRALEAPR